MKCFYSNLFVSLAALVGLVGPFEICAVGTPNDSQQLGTTSPLTGSQVSRPAEDRVKPFVVMITCDLGEEANFGTGIVFGAVDNRLYILTANHIVRKIMYSARNIKVHLVFRPGEDFEAKLLSNVDEALDLAVLSVEVPGASVGTPPFQVLGDPESLNRADTVYHVGNRWYVNVLPEKISRKSVDSLFFESNTIASGDSGGPLLNEARDIVGMVRTDQPPEGEAVRMDRILDKLREWLYPVALDKYTWPPRDWSARWPCPSHPTGNPLL
jgi:S1-C subfamily serine protease